MWRLFRRASRVRSSRPPRLAGLHGRTRTAATAAGDTGAAAGPAAGTPGDPGPRGGPPSLLDGGSAVPTVAAVAAVAATAAGAAALWAVFSAREEDVILRGVSDKVYDDTDNLLVFFVENSEDATRLGPKVRAFRAALPELTHVQFFFSEAPASKDGNEADDVKYAFYKGHRRLALTESEFSHAKAREFFAPVYETPPTGDEAEDRPIAPVPKVYGGSFGDTVLRKASAEHPIVVQIFEESCFLCFLMRPFMNSVTACLKRNQIPLDICKIDIEKNDFPDGLPVARGTPTFVAFRGGSAGEKVPEFRPHEIVERLKQEVSGLAVSDDAKAAVTADFEQLIQRMGARTSSVMQVTMWNAELLAIQSLSAATAKAAVRRCWKTEDGMLNAVLSEVMAADMKRVDLLDENLAHLARECTEAEADVLYAASTTLGDQVLALEQNFRPAR